MNKSKTKKLVLLTTVAILVLCFIPAVQAAKSSYKRPLLDWSVNNRSLGGWGSDTKIVYPDLWIGGVEEYEYSGHIIQKILKDGSFLLTVNLVVKDIWVEIYDSEMVLLLVGRANLNYQFVAILDDYIPGGTKHYMFMDPPQHVPVAAGPRGFWDELPWWLDMNFYGGIMGTQVLMGHVVMAGEGECTGEGGYEVGPATFNVNQVGMYKDFKPEHPKFYGVEGFWPVELIEIHQS